ncbi:MAG TPA: hypothetical protein VGI74_20855 [Streptosporangiaceae bacterium]
MDATVASPAGHAESGVHLLASGPEAMDSPDQGLATVAGPDKVGEGFQAGMAAPPRAGREPSWPRVLATTVRLWLKRRRRSYLLAAAVVIVAAAVLAGVLGQGASDGAGRGHGTGQPASPAAMAGRQAAGWVAAQVSHGTSVACDPATCVILQRRGFPASNLIVLRPGALDSLHASVIVATAALRGELGSRLAASYAPVLLAAFGTGSARAEIRAAAPDGQAAYLSQLRADTAARKAFGTELLLNPAVQASPLARQQLSSGQVDARLIATIAAMADIIHPVRLVSFGGASPRASPGVPLRSAMLYSAGGADATLGSLRAMLLVQHPLYRPAAAQIMRLPAGGSALRIVFAAPSPLGLLGAVQPVVRITPP